MNAAGDFVVAWQSYPQDGSFYGIFGRRFSAAGTALGPEFPVNTVTDNNQVVPCRRRRRRRELRRRLGGQGQDGSDYGIFGRRFDATGARSEPSFGSTASPRTRRGIRRSPRTTPASSSSPGTATPRTALSMGCFAQRYSPAGIPAAGEFQLNTYTPDRQMLSTVAADEEGRFVVAWRSFLQDGSTYGVYGRRVAALALRRRLRDRRRLRMDRHAGRRLPVRAGPTGQSRSRRARVGSWAYRTAVGPQPRWAGPSSSGSVGRFWPDSDRIRAMIARSGRKIASTGTRQEFPEVPEFAVHPA